MSFALLDKPQTWEMKKRRHMGNEPFFMKLYKTVIGYMLNVCVKKDKRIKLTIFSDNWLLSYVFVVQ